MNDGVNCNNDTQYYGSGTLKGDENGNLAPQETVSRTGLALVLDNYSDLYD